MYTKGDLNVAKTYYGSTMEIYLPHSCDEWVIGGRAEAEARADEADKCNEHLSQVAQQERESERENFLRVLEYHKGQFKPADLADKTLHCIEMDYKDGYVDEILARPITKHK